MSVREGLLALLHSGPCHGYALKSGFETATGGVWPLNVGQVYSTLDRLERDGLVESAGGNSDQRSWRLTDQGREELGEWWWAVPGEKPPPRDELVIKVLLAVAREREHALEVIGSQRDALMAVLAQRRRQARSRQTGRGDPLATQLVLDVLVMRTEADLRWLDLCEERVAAGNANDKTDGISKAARRQGTLKTQGGRR